MVRDFIAFCHTDRMTDMDIRELADLTAGDADVDNFERLFTKLKEMKGSFISATILTRVTLCRVNYHHFFLLAIDKASSMPHEQRKAHAEKVRCIVASNSKTTKYIPEKLLIDIGVVILIY